MIEFLAALKAVAAIGGAIVFAISAALYVTKKTPDQVNQEIDQQVAKEKQESEKEGRPT